MTDGFVNIHGKSYETVASRVGRFRESHPEYTIETQLIKEDETKVIMKALILDGERLLATGYAEEVRGSSNINSTSALENCETSAIGRCLAALGFAGTEYASADEVAAAIAQQREKELYAKFAATTAANERNHASLVSIREVLANAYAAGTNEEESAPLYERAREEWNEITDEDKGHIWVATTKGGWFTPRERSQMKWWSNDFENGRKG